MTLGRILIMTAFLIGLSGTALRAEGLPPTANATGKNFWGLFVLTTSENWAEIWNTPRTTSPTFDTSEVLKVGEKATLLVFFAHTAKPGENITLHCDLKITVGTDVTHDIAPQLCMDGAMPEHSSDLYMVHMNVGVEADEESIGKWTRFDIGLTDEKSGERIAGTVGFLTKAPEAKN